MSRTLSPNAVAAVNAQVTDEVVLMLLTIEEATLPAPLRFVNNTVDITSNSEVYTAFPFMVELPEETGQAPQPVRITIDGVDQTIVAAIRSAQDQPDITLQVILADSPDTVEAGPFVFKLDNVSYTGLTVTGSISYAGIDSSRSSNYKFTPHFFPDLF